MTPTAEQLADINEQMQAQDHVRRTALAELRRALAVFNGSATALAKAAGVSPSTITRPLKDPNTASLPKWATIVKLLDAAGLSPESYGGPTTAPNNFQLIEVVGEIRPGVWFEDVDDRDYGPNIVMVLEPLRPKGTLTAYVVGPEGIPYPPGTKAIVDIGRTPQSDDYVVMRRVKGDLIETFAALYQHRAGRHVYYKTGLDGTAQRYDSAPFSTEQPDIGTVVGPVVATVWVKS